MSTSRFLICAVTHDALTRVGSQALEDEVIWSYEISGAGTARVNGFYTQQNNGKYHNGAPRYRNSNNVFLSRELQQVAGTDERR